MPQYALRLPQDLYQRVQALAQAEGVSMNQFLLYAVSDTVSDLESRRFFEVRRGGMSKAEARAGIAAFLRQVPDVPPEPGDELLDLTPPSQPPVKERKPHVPRPPRVKDRR